MPVILQGLFVIFWLFIMPICMGLLPMQLVNASKRKLGMTIVIGYFVMFTTFEFFTMPIVLKVRGENFRYVKIGYTILALLIAITGVLLTYYRNVKKKEAYFTEKITIPGSKYVWGLAGVVLLFTLTMAMTHRSFDGDDAFYVVQSLLSQKTNTMYAALPYTGGTTYIDLRHAMAVFTMWIAYVATMSGMHSTIFCHTVLPLFIIPLTLLIYGMIGKQLLRDKEEMLPYFVVFMELIQLFGNVSLYTTETFLLTRTWQGKAMAGNVLFPGILLVLLILFERYREEKELGMWILLLIVNMSAGLFSSLAVVLGSMLICVAGFCMSIRERHFMTLVYTGLVCIPGAIYVLLYKFVWYLQ